MNPPLEQKARIQNSILLSLISAVFMIFFFLYFVSLPMALSYGILFGLFMGSLAYLFQINKFIEKQTLPEHLDQENLIYYGGANHFLNREGVGGRLFLLDKEIVFKSHRFNVQNHELIIKAEEIEKVECFNLVGFVPNGLKIRLKSGKIESFVVNNREVWKSMIENWISPDTQIQSPISALGT